MRSSFFNSMAAVTLDLHNLTRFVDAQADIYDDALAEIRSGTKRSHWMWFIFPQFAGLGSSEMSKRYAIQSIDEAREYLRHPILGARLIQCTNAVTVHRSRALEDIFGAVDAMKFRSSMTLFEVADSSNETIRAVLDTKCNAKRDRLTLNLLRLSAKEETGEPNNVSRLTCSPQRVARS